MRREGYEVVADWREITYVIGFVFVKRGCVFDGRRALMKERAL